MGKDTDGSALPHNARAEQGMLACMMLGLDWAQRGRDLLQDSDFYLDAHKLIFNAIGGLIEKGKPIEITFLGPEVDGRGWLDAAGGYNYLLRVMDTEITPAGLDHYSKEIVQHSLKRQAIGLGKRLIEAGFEDWDQFDRKRAIYEEQLQQIGTTFRQSETQSEMEDLMDVAGGFLSREQAQGPIGLSTGMSRLDRIIDGLVKTNLILVGARPSVGKTAFALSIVKHVIRRHPVLILSLEMSRKSLITRLLAMETGVSATSLKHEVPTGNDCQRVNQGFALLAEAVQKDRLRTVYVPDLNVAGLKREVRSAKAQMGAELVIVDYAQLMTETKGTNRNEEMTVISRGLKTAAMDFEVPVLALSQLSRKVEDRADKRPQLGDFRESGAIEQDADVAMGLYRPACYSDDKAPLTEPQDVEVLILKNREGEAGKMIPMRFLPDKTFFFETMGNGYE